jgi:hypothetical protein
VIAASNMPPQDHGLATDDDVGQPTKKIKLGGAMSSAAPTM